MRSGCESVRLYLEVIVFVAGYILAASPILLVKSFTTGRNLRIWNDCSASADCTFGTNKDRSSDHVSSSEGLRRILQRSGKRNDGDDLIFVQEDNMKGTENYIPINGTDCIQQNSADEDAQKTESIWNYLSDWFQGDFDNYKQVVEDRRQNLEPKEGGGHENFHCTLVPVSESSRLAAFYFDGNPGRIFRFRFYEMKPDENGEVVEMMLNTLHPALEKKLKSQAADPLSWPRVFENFQPTDEMETKVNRLVKCEISWSFERDPVQHSYLENMSTDDEDNSFTSLHAVMIHGPTVVNSTIVPGMQIRIVDQLSLFENTFYINDRGFDPLTGSFIYGNQREVPYRLERVSNILSNNTTSSPSFSSKDGDLQRISVNPDLEWTMGPGFRSTEEYERKIEIIGGPSVGIKKSSPGVTPPVIDE